MPAGKGTYGSKVGRPPEKKKKAPKRKAMTSLSKMSKKTTVPFKKKKYKLAKKVKLKKVEPLKLRRVKSKSLGKTIKKAPKKAKPKFKKSLKYRVDEPTKVRKEKSFEREMKARKTGAVAGLALTKGFIPAFGIGAEIGGGVEKLSFKIKEKLRRSQLVKMRERDKKERDKKARAKKKNKKAREKKKNQKFNIPPGMRPDVSVK